jgi:hypothetical protein
MKRSSVILILIISLSQSLSGQTEDNYSDKLLTSTFKVFLSADFELADYIRPFVRERFIKELKDTSSFSNPFDSLSNYIGIKYSSDSLIKTYCWSERNEGCCHTSETFVQYKTSSGKIKYVDLDELEEGNEEIFITDLYVIEIQNKPLYLILGWGTCCGGKHYRTARVYEFFNDTFVKSDSVFENEGEIYIEANRLQEIELAYSQDSKILSYNSFVYNKDMGFYTEEKTVVKWKLTTKGFRRIN